ECVVPFDGKFKDALIGFADVSIYRDRFDLWIDDPVLLNATALVELSLNDLVAPSCARRSNLHNQVGCALNVLRREYFQSGVRNEPQIRFDDIKLREDDIEWCAEGTPHGIRLEIRADADG